MRRRADAAKAVWVRVMSPELQCGWGDRGVAGGLVRLGHDYAGAVGPDVSEVLFY